MKMNNNQSRQVENKTHQVEDQMITDPQGGIQSQVDPETQKIQRGQENQVETQGI